MKKKKKAKTFIVHSSVDSVNLWNTRLKSLVKHSFLQTVSIRPLNVVLTADISKLVMRKLHSVEIKNMVLNIMNMFVTPAVMKMTVITMQR